MLNLPLMRRLYALDLIRALAIFSVIACHALEHALPASFNVLAEISPVKFVAYFAVLLFGRLGVPLFLFLTGYLLLNKKYDDQMAIRNFYKRNLLPLLLCWELWVLLLNVFLGVHSGKFDFNMYLMSALFLRDLPIGIDWYMPMIIGVYLFLPWVARVLRQVSTVQLAVVLGCLFIYSLAVPSANPFLALNNSEVGTLLNLSFAGGTYGFYLLLGYCFVRYKAQIDAFLARKFAKPALIVVGLGFGVLTILAVGALLRLGGSYNLWYDYFTLPLIAAVIFLLIERLPIRSARSQHLLASLSACAFGMYLLHEPIQMLLRDVLPTSWPRPVGFGVVLATSFLLSYAVVALARRIKSARVRQLLFYLK